MYDTYLRNTCNPLDGDVTRALPQALETARQAHSPNARALGRIAGKRKISSYVTFRPTPLRTYRISAILVRMEKAGDSILWTTVTP